MGNKFITYKGRDNRDYLAWRGGDDWYYRPVGEKGMTRVPYNYITPEGIRFYKSTDRGAVAKTFNEVSPSISNSKKSNFIPKESNLNSIGTTLPTVVVTAPRIKKLTTPQKFPLNSRVNSTLKINSSKKQVGNSKNKDNVPNNSISREINLPEVVITAPKISNSNNLKKETPKILVTALKPNAGETVKNNITLEPHYTRNYEQRVSKLGLNDRDAVKAIQRQLGVYVDGIWGDNTERAYLALYGNINKKDYTDPVQLGIDTNTNLTNTFAVANPKITSTRFNTNNLNLNTVPTFQDIINRPLSQLTFAKNGAKLVSKNPIKRFKSFKKC